MHKLLLRHGTAIAVFQLAEASAAFLSRLSCAYILMCLWISSKLVNVNAAAGVVLSKFVPQPL